MKKGKPKTGGKKDEKNSSICFGGCNGLLVGRMRRQQLVRFNGVHSVNGIISIQ